MPGFEWPEAHLKGRHLLTPPVLGDVLSLRCEPSETLTLIWRSSRYRKAAYYHVVVVSTTTDEAIVSKRPMRWVMVPHFLESCGVTELVSSEVGGVTPRQAEWLRAGQM